MKNLNQCLDAYIGREWIQNIAVRVGDRDTVYCDIYRYAQKEIDSSTLFDMASVTKIMATTVLTLIAMDKKLLRMDDCVNRFFHVPEEKRVMNIKHLLTHTMGIGHRSLNKNGVDYHNIQDYILSLSCDVEIGREVLYSCPGFILLGKIVEKVFDDRLDKLFSEHVAKPLELIDTTFLPDRTHSFVNSNLSEKEYGLVNDYNCRYLGGIAGNAGIFSNMEDVGRFVKMLHNYGEPLLKKETFDLAVKNYTPMMQESRGLGFLYVDKKYKQTGELFPEGSIGHCGHTGQSVFVDLESGLYTIILSDATVCGERKCGHEEYNIVTEMRKDIHNAIKKDLHI